MSTRSSTFYLTLAALSLGACSVREGRIALAPVLEARGERLEVRGMGGGTRGDFILAGVRGTFTRSAEQMGIFEPLLVRHRGGGTFRLDASTLPELAGRCSFREDRVNVGPLSITPQRLAFHCEFALDGRIIDAGLLLEDPKNAVGTLHGRAERIGTLFYEGHTLVIRSIHHDQSGGLPSPAALGYSFELEGEQMGAVDVNGLNKTIFAPRDGWEREAVIAGALALSIFWDPAAMQAD